LTDVLKTTTKEFGHNFKSYVVERFLTTTGISISIIQHDPLQQKKPFFSQLLFQNEQIRFEIDLSAVIPSQNIPILKNLAARPEHMLSFKSKKDPISNEVMILIEIADENSISQKLAQLTRNFEKVQSLATTLKLDVVFIVVFNGDFKNFKLLAQRLMKTVEFKALCQNQTFREFFLVWLSFPSVRSMKPIQDFLTNYEQHQGQAPAITINSINSPKKLSNKSEYFCNNHKRKTQRF